MSWQKLNHASLITPLKNPPRSLQHNLDPSNAKRKQPNLLMAKHRPHQQLRIPKRNRRRAHKKQNKTHRYIYKHISLEKYI